MAELQLLSAVQSLTHFAVKEHLLLLSSMAGGHEYSRIIKHAWIGPVQCSAEYQPKPLSISGFSCWGTGLGWGTSSDHTNTLLIAL